MGRSRRVQLVARPHRGCGRAASRARLEACPSDHARGWPRALAEAERAGAAGEVPIGAVVVRDGVATRGRGQRADRGLSDPDRARRGAGTARGGADARQLSPAGCAVYVTVEPCAMCVGAALQARDRDLVFGCHDPKAGAAGSLYDLTQDARLNHRIAVVARRRSRHAVGGCCKRSSRRAVALSQLDALRIYRSAQGPVLQTCGGRGGAWPHVRSVRGPSASVWCRFRSGSTSPRARSRSRSTCCTSRVGAASSSSSSVRPASASSSAARS